jgi:hypothetical protein
VPDNHFFMLYWFAAVLLWPPLFTFVLRPLCVRFGDDFLIDEVRERIGTAFHELAHAIVGLPFLLIPYRINIWNDDGSNNAGYVKQMGFTLLPFFGFYFSYFAPILVGLAFVLFAIKWVDGNSLSWFPFSDISYASALGGIKAGPLFSFLAGQAYLTVKGIAVVLLHAWYLALPVAFAL